MGIGGFIGSIGNAFSSVGSLLVKGIQGIINVGMQAVTFATSLLTSRLFSPVTPDYNASGGAVGNSRIQASPNTTTPIPIVYGSAFLGGKFCDAVLSVDQKVMRYVLAITCLSEYGSVGIDQTKMWYGDRLITFDGTDGAKVVSLTDSAGNVDTSINGNLYVFQYYSDKDGNITSLTSNPTMPWNVITTAGTNPVASGQQWTSTGRRMNGLVFAIAVLTYNQTAGTTQLQPITFKVTQNLAGEDHAGPGSVWADYMTNTIYGGAVPIEYIDLDSVTALNAYSNELITFNDYEGNPQTQPRYRINGVLDSGKGVLQNIDQIMTACDSWMQYNATTGKWAVVINKAESASMAFSDDNIIGDITVGSVDITQTPNKVEAKFPDATNRDQYNYVNESVPSYLLMPNEPVNKISLTYELVNNSVQALYLANRFLEQNREDLTVTILTNYQGIQVNAGDVISITNAAYGWDEKLFRALQVKEEVASDMTLGASIQCIEYNAQVYDDKDITQYVPAGNSNLVSPYYFPSLPALSIVNQTPSATIPEFTLQITIPSNIRVTEVDAYYQVATSSGALTENGWKLGPVQRPISGQAFPAGSTVDFVVTGIPPTPTGVQYFFSYILKNEVSQSNLATSTPGYIWSPNVITPSALATAYEWAPINVPVPTDIYGTPITVGQEVSVYLRIGTSVIDIWDGTGTQPDNSWGITSWFASTGLTVTGPVYNPAGDTATWTVTDLTTPSAYISVSGTYRDSSSVDTLIGDTQVSVIQQVGGASSPTLTIEWDPTNQITKSPDGIWYPTPIGGFIYTQMNLQAIVNGAVVGQTAWVLEYDIASKGASASPGTYPGGNINQSYFNLINVAVADYGFTFQATYTDPTTTPPVFAFNNGTVSVVESGVSTITSALSKSTQSLTADTSGTVTAGLPTTVTMQVLIGNVDDTANWTYVTTASNCTISTGANTNSPTVSAVSANSASVTIVASKTGYPNQTRIFTLSKSLQGATGSSGSTGPRTGTGYLYYAYSTSSPPSAPTASGYDFTNGTFSSLTSGWSTTFTAPNPSTSPTTQLGSSFWATRYSVSEATYGGSQTVSISAVFNWQNLNGLVTFTNVQSPSGTTFIDGGNIIADTITVNRIKNNTSGSFNGGVFSLGTGSTVAGLAATGVFQGTNSTWGVVATNPSSGGAFAAASVAGTAAVFANTYNSAYNTYRTSVVLADNNYGVVGAAPIWGTQGIIAQNGYAFYAGAGGYGPFTGTHDSLIANGTTLNVGDIVIDTGIMVKKNINDIISIVDYSSTANQSGVLGVVSSSNALTNIPAALAIQEPDPVTGLPTNVLNPEYQDLYDSNQLITVNAVGEGQINVCGQNGDIAIGDLIVTSSMAGKGMKQADDIIRSYTVAKSRENVTFSSPTEVKMIGCTYVSG